MTDEPQGEQIINCMFCDEDPLQEGHYRVGKHLLQKGKQVFAQLSITCTNALPPDRPGLWLHYTVFLTESLACDKAGQHVQEGEHEPAIPIAKEDEAWAERLLKRLVDGDEDEAERKE